MFRKFLSYSILLCGCMAVVRVQAQSAAEMCAQVEKAMEAGDIFNGFSLLETALQKAARDSGSNSLTYATVADFAATIYNSAQLPDGALTLSTRATGIFREKKGRMNTDYVGALVNIGNAYIQKGQYMKADSILQEAKKIMDVMQLDTSKTYAWVLGSIGNLYQRTARSNDAVEILQQGIDIYKKYYPGDISEYVFLLNNKGACYLDDGLYDKAGEVLNEAAAIYKKIGTTHWAYPMFIANLGTLYMQTGKLQEAETFYLQALQEAVKNKLAGHDNEVLLLNNIGMLYVRQERYAEADAVLQQSLRLFEKIPFGKDSRYAGTLNNLALVCIHTKEWKRADSALSKAMSVYSNQLGTKSPEYNTALLNKGAILQYSGAGEEAAATYAIANNSLLNYWKQNFSGLSEKEKLGMSTLIEQSIQLLPSLLHTGKVSLTPAIRRQLYSEQLAWRGAVLLDQQELVHTMAQQQDAFVKALYNTWVESRQAIVMEEKIPFRSKRSIDSLQRVAERAEKELSKRLTAFRWHNNSNAPDPVAIANTLRPGEAAVEFFQYACFDGEWKDSLFYAALVLTHGDSLPAVVQIAESRQLQQLLHHAGTLKNKSILLAQIYPDVSVITNPAATRGYQLYQLIWKPLLPYLKKATTVYVAPAGLLHQVALSALPVGKNRLLADDCAIHYMFSTRNLLQSYPQNKWQHASLWGGIDYGSSVAKAGTTRGTTQAQWPQLPYTLEEVKNIAALMKARGITAQLFTGNKASKENFVAVMQSKPGIMHIATHGYYHSGFTSTRLLRTLATGDVQQEEDPLLRSGLVLSNANKKTATGQSVQKDGIITAYEIADKDLSGTALVTLSACETALGDIHSSEGIFGLQRAFKLAGVHSIIMSLWKVPDKPTAELMTAFYSYLLNGETIRTAFTKTQQQMRKKYPPYYWAGFVLVE